MRSSKGSAIAAGNSCHKSDATIKNPGVYSNKGASEAVSLTIHGGHQYTFIVKAPFELKIVAPISYFASQGDSCWSNQVGASITLHLLDGEYVVTSSQGSWNL